MPDQGLLFAHDHDDLPEPGESGRRCTPELLWEFIEETRARTGKSPTLLDCKGRFGGILGPLVCGWELQRRGLLLDPEKARYRYRLNQLKERPTEEVLGLIRTRIREETGK